MESNRALLCRNLKAADMNGGRAVDEDFTRTIFCGSRLVHGPFKPLLEV